jgi:uncharacterized protein YprB with RNaseH-like and TPR domain
MVNMNQFSRKELIKMASSTCKHGHKYIAHPNCYLIEQEKEKKIGYFDIESGGLQANFDYMLTWSIKTRDKNEYKTGCISALDIQNYTFDKRILKELIIALKEYDIILGYYSTKFDIPFVRTRALMNKLDFIEFGALLHKDVYYMVKMKMRLHRNSLDSACAALGIKGKNHIKGNFWMKAKLGDPVALAYVLDHNKKDCQILEQLHKRLENYVKDSTKSI